MNQIPQGLADPNQMKNNEVNSEPMVDEKDEGQKIINLLIEIKKSNSRNTLLHGGSFQNLLEARDHVLEHECRFIVFAPLEKLSENVDIRTTIFFNKLKKKINKFLVESVSNVTSISFDFFRSKRLEENEAKDFAAKNILLNIHNILSQTLKAVRTNDLLKHNNDFIKQLEFYLSIEADTIVCDVMENLAGLYPQASPSGGTPRMRKMINKINRAEDETTDFIFANDISIDQAEVDSKDHTGFIIKVINKVINITQLDEDWKDRTIREKFDQFNEHLFWLSQEDEYHAITRTMDLQLGNKNIHLKKEKQKYIQNIVDMFSFLLVSEGNEGQKLKTKIDYIKEQVREVNQKSVDEREKQKKTNYEEYLMISLMGRMQKGLEDMKSNPHKKYLLGQKIPSFVQEFNKQEIMNQTFSTKHSSILRILTKWNESLKQIFKDKEKHIKQRLYSFKNLTNSTINLTENNCNILIKNLDEHEKQVQKDLIRIKYSLSQWTSKLLTTPEEQPSEQKVCRYTSTRILSSKINRMLVSSTLSYTNSLIDHLFKAGNKISGQVGPPKKLNLVVLGIYDLLRAKLQCSENSFVSLLQTMYLLDKSPEMKDKFKLVRIKNKLDQKDSNIIINYLFMGKVQCQLQLSIQVPAEKSKQYYCFSHFIYQLQRGTFGVLAECANMIAQHDPLLKDVNSNSQYSQKQYREHPYKKIDLASSMDQTMLHCSMCRKLIALSPNINYNICLECALSRQNPEEIYLQKERLKNCLASYRRSRITNFKDIQLTNLISLIPLLIVVNDREKMDLYLIINNQKEKKHFMVQISDGFLEDKNQQYQFDKLSYMLISEDIKNKKQVKFFMYQAENIDIQRNDASILIPNGLLQIAGVNESYFQTDKIKKCVESFLEFRRQKKIVKDIRERVQIMKIYENEYWKTLDKIFRLIGMKKIYTILQRDTENNSEEPLKYKKYKQIDISCIQYLGLTNLRISEMPQWFKFCEGLTILKIKQITDLKDISLINQNYQLKEISVQNCSNIITIKLNQLLSIKKIELQQCQRLQTLEVSLLPQLVEMYLKATKINELKFKDLPLLKTVQLISNNRLSVMDFKNLPSFQRLTLEGNEQLKYLKLNSLQVFKYCTFEFSFVQKIDFNEMPKLQTLSLQKCQNLKILTLMKCCSLGNLKIQKNINLEQIILEETPNIKHLKVQHIRKLRIIKLRDVGLTEVKFAENQQLTDINIQKIKALKQIQVNNVNNKKLTNIYLSNLPKLKNLNLNGRIVLSRIQLNELPLLESLITCDQEENTVEMTIKISKLLSLLHLDLKFYKNIDHLSLNQCSKLKSVNLKQTCSLKSIKLNDLPQMKTLNISQLPSLPIKSLAELPSSLEQIIVSNTDIKKKLKKLMFRKNIRDPNQQTLNDKGQLIQQQDRT